MLIKCEKCSILYEVPSERLISERPHFLKCSACGHVFTAPKIDSTDTTEKEIPAIEQTDSVPMALSEIFQEETADENQATEENVETKVDQNPDLFEPLETAEEFTPIENTRAKHLHLLWIILIFILIAGIILFYVGRFFFVRQTPIAERLYRKAGIETNILGEGLTFQNTVFDLQKNAVNYELFVKSELFNTTDEVKTIPTIVIHLTDSRGKVIQSEKIRLDKNTLGVGETHPFEKHIKTLSDKARHIEITFERNKN